ncbi:hypothetical protein EDC01DRAFT_623292 [Geopyxis carbonaria]|nr:hypothetical protein EDC01DRAFT_623292 [Geopyxis carbonaria]
MAPAPPPPLTPIPASSLTPTTPTKRINTHPDLTAFPTTPGYALVTSFIAHLNACVSPLDSSTNTLSPAREFTTDTAALTISPPVAALNEFLSQLSELIDAVPPVAGPRRYGNTAFRTWLSRAGELVEAELDAHLPEAVRPAAGELKWYLKHAFGSGERLDYGTGHELNFAAFLAGVWKLGGFVPGRDEKALVLKTFAGYFEIVRRLVLAYSLEPAGSHGVWGLDDHAFLPYVFGSAQLTTYKPALDAPEGHGTTTAEEQGLPKPDEVVKKDVVDRERSRNLYFAAIGFVYDVKTGPFWEHSPILFDISGVQKGWGKINEGLLKMYAVEVLGKFPVVQHFHFGSIFEWGVGGGGGGGDAKAVQPSTAAGTGTSVDPAGLATAIGTSRPPPPAQLDGIDTRAPWAATPHPAPMPSSSPPNTRAPWANASPTTMSPALHASPTTAPRSPALHAPRSPALHAPVPRAATPPPWETAVEDAPAEVGNVRSEANVGGKRTCSPDSALAATRRGSTGVGEVRVAETGDLSGRRASRDVPRV